MLAKSAALILGKHDSELENDNINFGGGLGGELRELEDMDGSFNGCNPSRTKSA